MGGMTSLLLLLWVGLIVGTVVDLQKRILKGHNCGPRERLYHVLLIARNETNSSWCGGSLISDQWILTAAHCWKPGWNITAHLGVHPRQEEGTRKRLQVQQITEHPKIFTDQDNNNDREHDIMLLKLPNKVQITPVKPPDCDNQYNAVNKTGAIVQIAGNAANTTGPNNTKGITGSTVVALQKRIIGGQPCERQYHVKLKRVAAGGSSNMCGGSLISDRWILTAAHCLKPGRTMFAGLGVHPEVQITAEPVNYTDKDNRFHDIMLLQLPEPTKIQPVALPDCEYYPKMVKIAGHAATTGGPNDERRKQSETDDDVADGRNALRYISVTLGRPSTLCSFISLLGSCGCCMSDAAYRKLQRQ
ncbi:kallikrein-8-like [Morone saxatilis]|uniref:kallikrein-8-like n=1 Tax=Morone saxatilis TaxID=34816 RepID=UPI0015E20249|nr:kallikrein-8-like [Morone saxatilis]